MSGESQIDRWNKAVLEVNEWLEGDLRLEKAETTVLHQLIAAHRDRDIVRPPNFPETRDSDSQFDHGSHVFLIQHDWLGAFATAAEFAADEIVWDFPLPYTRCCFELQVSGKRICLAAIFDGANSTIALRVRLKVGWTVLSFKPGQFLRIRNLVFGQVRAVVIALEAQIAQTSIVRAPEKLNRARERNHRPPIADYHVVDLARRSRPTPLPNSAGDARAGVRLHFRRGHWRHFENHRSWVKWTLVGDPDLGFIDKHYLL